MRALRPNRQISITLALSVVFHFLEGTLANELRQRVEDVVSSLVLRDALEEYTGTSLPGSLLRSIIFHSLQVNFLRLLLPVWRDEHHELVLFRL